MRNDNIAAISTASGAAGVAVIRISGESPLKIAEKIFKPTGKTKVENFVPNMMYAGEIVTEAFCDYGMCVYFKAPKSFTGEDTVEFHTHGGIAITRGVLKEILSNGARLATNGEFTKRAFMNGKLSLSSAEGLIDMINSESESGVRAGYSLYREKLNKKVGAIQDELLDALSQIDADMDFPDEGLEETSLNKTQEVLNSAVSKIDALLKTFNTGRVIKNGVKVAICGKPNTGKSSLLNALLDYEKAIVSDVAGTTRDVVEGVIDVSGVRFNLYDTAGIREATDEIEGLGVKLSKKVLKNSDIVVMVMDAENIDKEDDEIYEIVKDKNLFVVVNKSDKSGNTDSRADLYVSAKTGKNLEEFKKQLYSRTIGNVDTSADFLCEERHFEALNRAKDKLEQSLNAINNVPLDILSIDIKAGWQALGEISGKTATEEIIDNIFSKFCVGK